MNPFDIESKMVFMCRKEVVENFGRTEASEDGVREMNEFESELMRKFEENDNELDEMLDVVINQIDGLKIHAENIGTAIVNQKEIIKKLNSEAEKARQNLVKRSSALENVLKKYRTNRKICVDLCLITILLILVGVIIGVLKNKDIILKGAAIGATGGAAAAV